MCAAGCPDEAAPAVPRDRAVCLPRRCPAERLERSGPCRSKRAEGRGPLCSAAFGWCRSALETALTRCRRWWTWARATNGPVVADSCRRAVAPSAVSGAHRRRAACGRSDHVTGRHRSLGHAGCADRPQQGSAVESGRRNGHPPMRPAETGRRRRLTTCPSRRAAVESLRRGDSRSETGEGGHLSIAAATRRYCTGNRVAAERHLASD